MTLAHDIEDLAIDQIAERLYWQMSVDEIRAATGVDVPVRTLWRELPLEVRQVFRARAERFMMGNTSLIPWSMPPGMVVPI